MASFRTTEDYARFRLAEDCSAAGRDRETGSQKLLSSQAQTTPVRISPAELEDSIQRLLLGGHAAEGHLALTALLALSDALSGGTQSEVRHAAVKLVLSRRHEPGRARAVPGEESRAEAAETTAGGPSYRRRHRRSGKDFNGL